MKTKSCALILYTLTAISMCTFGSYAQSAKTPMQSQTSPKDQNQAGLISFQSKEAAYNSAERDWSMLISKLDEGQTPSDSQIHSFVNQVLGLDPKTDKVCSAGFFRFSGNETYSLVASIDVNGRHFCNDVEVIDKYESGIRAEGIFAWNVNDIHAIVQDIGKNGKNELVIPTGLSGYEGAAKCIVTCSPKSLPLKTGILS